MNAAEPRNLSALFVDLNAQELAAASAATGEKIGTIALRKIRASMDAGHRISGDVWRTLPLELRELLVAMNCPELDDSRYAARQAWATFTDEQRGRIGAYARWMRRTLEGAQWLAR